MVERFTHKQNLGGKGAQCLWDSAGLRLGIGMEPDAAGKRIVIFLEPDESIDLLHWLLEHPDLLHRANTYNLMQQARKEGPLHDDR